MKRNLILMFIIMSTLAASGQEEMGGALSFHYDELLETKKEVEAYTSPEENLYMVSGGRYEYFLRSISPKAREKWDKQWLTNPDHKKKFDEAYKAVVAAATKKMALYLPGNELFAFHNPTEEQMMKSKLKNLSTLKIHKIGLLHSTWQISKDDYGVIDSRYKRGYIWARDSSDDHGFCHLYQVNIKQDYSGGGTYGESYALFIDDSLRGCPK